MGRRKSQLPQRVCDEKRQCLAWSMSDVLKNKVSVQVIEDNDPSLIEELSSGLKVASSRNTSAREQDVEAITDVYKENWKRDFEAEFNENLQNCLCFIALNGETDITLSEWRCMLGKFIIHISPDERTLDFFNHGHLPVCSQCYYYCNERDGDKSMLYYELVASENNKGSSCYNTDIDIQKLFVYCNTNVPIQCLQALAHPVFSRIISHYDPEKQEIEVGVYITESAIVDLSFASEPVKTAKKKSYASLQTVVGHFFNIYPPAYPGCTYTKKHDLDSLFRVVKECHLCQESCERIDVQHASLKPCLRPYQKEGVHWMLCKEKHITGDLEDHPVYTPIDALDGQQVYYNRFIGSFVRTKPLLVRRPPGGILADEMGLGKTVEVLACILLHPRTDIPDIEPLPVIEDAEELIVSRVSRRDMKGLADRRCSNDSEKIKGASPTGSDVKSEDNCHDSSNNLTSQADTKSIHSVLDIGNVLDSCDVIEYKDFLKSANNGDSCTLIKDEPHDGNDEAIQGPSCSTINVMRLQSASSTNVLRDDTCNKGKDLFTKYELCVDDGDVLTRAHGTDHMVSELSYEDATETKTQLCYSDDNVAVVNSTNNEVGDRSTVSIQPTVLAREEPVSANSDDTGEDSGVELSFSVEGSLKSAEGTSPSVERSLKSVEGTSPSVKRSLKFVEGTSPSVEGSLKSVEGTSQSADGSLVSAEDKLKFKNLDSENMYSTHVVIPTKSYDSDLIHRTNCVGLDHTYHVSVSVTNDSSTSSTPLEHDSIDQIINKVIADGIRLIDDSSHNEVLLEESNQASLTSKVRTNDNEDSSLSSDRCVPSRISGSGHVYVAGCSCVMCDYEHIVKHASDATSSTNSCRGFKKTSCLRKVKNPDKRKSNKSKTTNKVNGQIRKTKLKKSRKRSFHPEFINSHKMSSYQEFHSDGTVRVVKDTINKAGVSTETMNHETNPINGYFNNECFQESNGLECICGIKASGHGYHGIDARIRVQCNKCSLWQHAECVGYDLTDPLRGPYLCPHCHVISPLIPSGATLIISPGTIAAQWEEEINKHIRKKSIQVLIYNGVHRLGFIQPQKLASYDIVITTYEVLRKEIDYVDLPHSNSDEGRKLRHPKRFMAVPSPIIAVEWWRICLDEAQMVECTTTKTAEMALRLSSVNRWCVTGTPIQKSIEDLYGLLLFLGVDPYWVQRYWKQLLFEPFCYGIKEPLCDIVSQILWRTTKADVIDQINLPDQTEQIHWLEFSPVESHFYIRQFHFSFETATKSLSTWTDKTTKLSSLDRETVSKLLSPLLHLRQACCHPQAVRGAFISLQRNTMTMEELLESLIKKATGECEESHRKLVFATNALAGVHIIKNEYLMAVDLYREVLMSVEKHRSDLRTDDLQQIHALHNLCEILDGTPEGVLPTLRDSLLKQQADELRDKYLTKAHGFVLSKQELLTPTQHNIADIEKEMKGAHSWWMDLLQWSVYVQRNDQVVEKVQADLMDNRTLEVSSIADKFRDVRGLQYVLELQVEALEATRKRLCTMIKNLQCKITQDIVNETVECCLRPITKELGSCRYCHADKLFTEYESKLFSIVDSGVYVKVAEDDDKEYNVATRRQGNWSDSELERALKSILTFGRSFQVDPDLVENGGLHLKLFEAMKKEFKALRWVWVALKEEVSAYDELGMATIRLRLRYPDEEKADPPQSNILEPTELPQQQLKYMSDRIIEKNELQKKLGQLLYLHNLDKAHKQTGEGVNPEPCPICQSELGKEWCVLTCGHCFCPDCIRIMLDRYSFGGNAKQLKCPMCRENCLIKRICYVSTKQDNLAGDGEIDVKGDHSTKVKAVVKCLLEIKRDEATAKVLIFSSWLHVLILIGKALEDNDVKFSSLVKGNNFQKNLRQFRHEAVTALLIPVHSGSNGLNLIEATHVLLVEPLLNPAQELQAIGRVHRIGQTKPTHIHRFLVKNTVEQRIHEIMRTSHENDMTTTRNDNDTPLTISELSSILMEEGGVHVEEDNDGEGSSSGPGIVDMREGSSSTPGVADMREGSSSAPGVADVGEGNSSGTGVTGLVI